MSKFERVLSDDDLAQIIHDVAWPNDEIMSFAMVVAIGVQQAVLAKLAVQEPLGYADKTGKHYFNDLGLAKRLMPDVDFIPLYAHPIPTIDQEPSAFYIHDNKATDAYYTDHAPEAQEWAAKGVGVTALYAHPMPSKPYSIDKDEAGIRELVASAITGTIHAGLEGGEAPPTGHWLSEFYEYGAAYEHIQTQLQKNEAACVSENGESDTQKHVTEEYRRFCAWCDANPSFDLDYRLHSHSGPIGSGGYISNERTRVAFAAWRSAKKALVAAPKHTGEK